jgi:O-antigen ligase
VGFDARVVATAPTRTVLLGHLAAPAAWSGIAAALGGCATLVALGLADGGVYPRAWRLATLAFAAIAAAALLARPRIETSRLEWGVLAALAALVGWTALSGTWSGQTPATLAAERSATYLALVLAVLLAVDRQTVPALLVGALAGITLVAGYGLGEYLVRPPPLDPFEGRLLHRPLGYANALGIYTTIGALLSIGLAAAARRAALRVAALAPLAVLVPALLLTSSRGAWLALAAGLVTLVALHRPARGRSLALQLAIAAAAVAAVLVVSGGSDRADYWRVALEDARDHPLLGSGAGTYGEYWLAHGPGGSFTRTAHSLYLQSLAELGPLGLLLVAAALALPLVRLGAARASPVAAAAGAAYVAYALHTGLDWDWEMPATTVAGLVCGAGLLVATRAANAVPLRLAPRAALIAVALALVLAAVVRVASGPSSPFAT